MTNRNKFRWEIRRRIKLENDCCY